jgi:glycosyltransferase involved in cell wall biosynthesis
VAIAAPYSWPEVRRGGERYLHDLAWLLREAGHGVRIVAGTQLSSRVDEVDGIIVHRRRYRALPSLPVPRHWIPPETFGAVAWPWLARNRADLVIALTPSAAIAARATGHRVVFTYLGRPNPEWWALHPAEEQYFRWAMRCAHATTVLSTPAANMAEHITGKMPVVLPPGIRLDRFPSEVERSPYPLVLFASSCAERGKGLDVLFQAFDQLLNVVPQAKLRLIGPGDYSWAVDTLPSSAAYRVRRALETPGVGLINDVPDEYARAHTTAMPSRGEAFGLVMLESLACGTPCVGSAAEGVLDVLSGCAEARLVPYGDVVGLTRALAETIALAQRSGTAAGARAHAAAWDWSKRGPEHLALYEEVGTPHGGLRQILRRVRRATSTSMVKGRSR